MSRDRLIPVYALNIAATPHPAGIYVRLLTVAAKYLVQAHGSDYARISPPKESQTPGLYTGRILMWTEIDLRGKWYDLTADDELSPELRRTIVIPDNAKPNFKVFDYVFSEKKHRLYFESKDEFGHSLGPATARRIFERLLSQERHGLKAPNVEVTIVPRDGTVSRILKLPGLRKLTMRVVLPNPDATDSATLRRVRKRLMDANAKQLDQTYTKQAGAARLTATKEIQDVAAVASQNGFVKGEGYANGHAISLATSDDPRREMVDSGKGVSFITRLLATVGIF